MRFCSDLLHILLDATSSLYLCTLSSLKRDFTRLMWDDRWILRRESDKQITEELRIKSFRKLGEQDSSRRILTSQTYGFAHHYTATLWKKQEKGLSILQWSKRDIMPCAYHQINIHTPSKPVFTIMLMNCHYLLQQHLHLLTAVRDRKSEFKQLKAMRSPLRLESQSTSCHWPASLQAWPVLSAEGPGGSQTLGCQQRI